MKTLSKIIYKALAGIKEIEKSVYPIVANAGSEFPLITYKVSMSGKLTKDRAKDYTVTIGIFHTDYEKLLDMIQAVDAAIGQVDWQSVKYRFNQKNIDVDFVQQDNVYRGIIIYNNIKT